MNWLDFGVTRAKVKGHRAHYVCKNSLWSRYLKNRLMDSYQTLVMYVTCRAYELIRFWGHEVKGHRAHYVCKKSLWSRYLKNWLMDSYQTLVMYVTCRANELIKFWGSRGQRSQGSICMQKIACDRVISRTDWWIPAKLRLCMYLARANELIRFWGQGQRSWGSLCMQK